LYLDNMIMVVFVVELRRAWVYLFITEGTTSKVQDLVYPSESMADCIYTCFDAANQTLSSDYP